jgi:hypothetical protein
MAYTKNILEYLIYEYLYYIFNKININIIKNKSIHYRNIAENIWDNLSDNEIDFINHKKGIK